MTNYTDECKRLAEADRTNKMLAAVHEMGHYLVATHIISDILQVTVECVQLLPSISGKWYGFTRVKYEPKSYDGLDPDKYNLELCRKKIKIANAGKSAELAMLGKTSNSGYADDEAMANEAISYIREKAPGFNVDAYVTKSNDELYKSMSKHLNLIAKLALSLYHKPHNAVIQYPEEIDQQ